MQVSFWTQLEDCFTNLESYRLHLFLSFIATLMYLTEGGIGFAIKIWNLGSPLILQDCVWFWWNSNERASCVNYSCKRFSLVFVVQRFSVVLDILRIQSPASNGASIISRIVLECLKARLSSNDLGGIISSKKGIRLVILITLGQTKWHYWSWNNIMIV